MIEPDAFGLHLTAPAGTGESLPTGHAADRTGVGPMNAFARRGPSVQVIVKKRRLPVVVAADGDRADNRSPSGAATTRGVGDGPDRGPKVHRLASTTALQAPGGESHAALATTAEAPSPRRRRRRTAADPLRQPSPVRIVVQAPPSSAAAQDEPAWRRILCTPPAEFGYRQVLESLRELETTLEDARHAQGWTFVPDGG